MCGCGQNSEQKDETKYAPFSSLSIRKGSSISMQLGLCHNRPYSYSQYWTGASLLKFLAFLSIFSSRNNFKSKPLSPNFSACCLIPMNSIKSQSDSLLRRAKARNVSFSISVRWSIYIINSVDKPNFRVSLPHRRSTTVSLETNPLYSLFTLSA